MTAAQPHRKKLHRYHSPWKRGLYSLALVLTVLIMGTLGFHLIEHCSYVDAFYLSSMIATAQGPTQPLVTQGGKLFASAMAFISVGTVVASAGFLFGPFLGELWAIGHHRHYPEQNEREHS